MIWLPGHQAIAGYLLERRWDGFLREEVHLLVPGSQIGAVLVKEVLPPRVWPENQKEAIEATWEEAVAKNPSIFPGPVCLLTRAEVSPAGELLLSLEESTYKVYLGLRTLTPKEVVLGEDGTLSHPLVLGMGAIAITRPSSESPNGDIVFGVRGRAVGFPGKLQSIPAEGFNPAVDCMTVGDPGQERKQWFVIQAILRGLYEELGISWFQSAEPLGLCYETAAKGVSVAFRIALPYTSSDLRVRGILRDMGTEIAQYLLIPNTGEGIKKVLEAYRANPQTIARCILHLTQEPKS